jgi:hypothetical protein
MPDSADRPRGILSSEQDNYAIVTTAPDSADHVAQPELLECRKCHKQVDPHDCLVTKDGRFLCRWCYVPSGAQTRD